MFNNMFCSVIKYDLSYVLLCHDLDGILKMVVVIVDRVRDPRFESHIVYISCSDDHVNGSLVAM